MQIIAAIKDAVNYAAPAIYTSGLVVAAVLAPAPTPAPVPIMMKYTPTANNTRNANPPMTKPVIARALSESAL